MKTKVTEFLDKRKVKYRLLLHKNNVFTCEEAACERLVPLDEMIKCILLVSKKKQYFLACLPADKKLELHKMRRIVKSSRLSFASVAEIKEITGYERGSLPPLLLAKEILSVFDDEIIVKRKINISSGNALAGIELAVESLIILVDPLFAKISKL